MPMKNPTGKRTAQTAPILKGMDQGEMSLERSGREKLRPKRRREITPVTERVFRRKNLSLDRLPTPEPIRSDARTTAAP
jgi:hypothetical protein